MSKNYESSDDENFEDALDNVKQKMEMDLETSIEETLVALNLFLNNRFSEALDKMKPWANQSMYHALGYGTILYMQAIMTYESEDIMVAIDALKKAGHVCQRFRKKTSVGLSLKRIVSKTDYDSFTESQIHAELCHAECLLLRALLTFIQDENLVNFIKGGMKIRTCYSSYKECLNLLQKYNWQNVQSKSHFESGVKMGVGAFNLLISQLPGRILKLLEFLGFSGNRYVGLKELDEGFSLSKSLRGPLCSTILLVYHTIVTFILGTGDGDIKYAEGILQQMLCRYPKGAIFGYFSGRLEEIKGNIDEAISKFESSIAAQTEWIQFHHICYWELIWCYCFNCNWAKAAEHSELLRKGSKWSKATYCYQQAAFLCMQESSASSSEVKQLMSEVPNLRQRIAGKSLPIEKFASKKSQRFFNQGNRLFLPALELVYVWNGFSIVGKKKSLALSFFEEVEKAEKILNSLKGKKFYMDNYCLLLFLKGMCLRCINNPLQAEECFLEVYKNEKNLVEDLYLVPFALLELGLLSMDTSDYTTAEALLEKARSNYKGFSLEGRLHFRVHAALSKIKSQKMNLSVPIDNPLPTPDHSPSSSHPSSSKH